MSALWHCFVSALHLLKSVRGSLFLRWTFICVSPSSVSVCLSVLLIRSLTRSDLRFHLATESPVGASHFCFSLLLRHLLHLLPWLHASLCWRVSFAPSFLLFPFACLSWVILLLSSCLSFAFLSFSSGVFCGFLHSLEVLPVFLPNLVPSCFVLMALVGALFRCALLLCAYSSYCLFRPWALLSLSRSWFVSPQSPFSSAFLVPWGYSCVFHFISSAGEDLFLSSLPAICAVTGSSSTPCHVRFFRVLWLLYLSSFSFPFSCSGQFRFLLFVILFLRLLPLPLLGPCVFLFFSVARCLRCCGFYGFSSLCSSFFPSGVDHFSFLFSVHILFPFRFSIFL